MPADSGSEQDDEPPRYVRIGNALLAITEDVIYVGIALVLVVGIIASINEIIVLSVAAAGYVGTDTKFEHAMMEVAVLGVLVLVLAAAAIMLRAKERQPEEGNADAGAEGKKDGKALNVTSGDPQS